MFGISVIELKRFLKIQAFCLLIATFILASHPALPINRGRYMDWFYVFAVSLVGLSLVIIRRFNQEKRNWLISIGLIYTVLAIVVAVLFFIR